MCRWSNFEWYLLSILTNEVKMNDVFYRCRDFKRWPLSILADEVKMNDDFYRCWDSKRCHLQMSYRWSKTNEPFLRQMNLFFSFLIYFSFFFPLLRYSALSGCRYANSFVSCHGPMFFTHTAPKWVFTVSRPCFSFENLSMSLPFRRWDVLWYPCTVLSAVKLVMWTFKCQNSFSLVEKTWVF